MTPDAGSAPLSVLDSRNFQDPYPNYRRLRESDPVFWDERHLKGAWVLTRYNDISCLLKDPRVSSDRYAMYRLVYKGADGESAFDDSMSRMMLFLDPPKHTRLRSLVTRAFTPRSVEVLRPKIQAITDSLLDRAERAGKMEVIADLAMPLPVTVIAELLGVPPADGELLKQWSVDITHFLGNFKGLSRAVQANAEFRTYLGEHLQRKKRAPGDDLMSALILAEEDGQRLEDADILATCILLLNAGHETTTHLIGNGIHALLKYPEQLEILRKEPTVLSTAIEEILRFDGTAQLVSRIAKEPIELYGKCFAPGHMLLCFVAAANRDPEQFPDPERFDVRRTENRHLAFAQGPHFCLGAALARLEAEIAIGTMVRRFPRLQLTGDTLSWQPSLLLRGLTALPVTTS